MKLKYLLLGCVLVFGLSSCKKEKSTPPPSQLILGKWYLTNLVSVLYRDSAIVGTSNQSNFTNDDFVEYYNDGSGYYSTSTTQGPSLSEFTYSVSGTTITQYTNSQTKGQPETISSISASNLALHVVQLVPDPGDPTLTDTEVDNITYSRQL